MSHFRKLLRGASNWEYLGKIEVTGSGPATGPVGAPGFMTGTILDFALMPAGTTVIYGSGSFVPGDSRVYPSGSFAVQLGTVPGMPAGKLTVTDDYFARFEASGTDAMANSLATVQQYRLVQYGHVTVSGTYVFGFQRLSGSSIPTDAYGVSGSFVGAVPQDRINPSSMVGKVIIGIKGRK